jgi:hypothetical protein
VNKDDKTPKALSPAELIQGIRTIAKTGILEEKVNKALKEAAAVKKANIESQRISTGQRGSNADITARTDTGAPVEAPLNPPPSAYSSIPSIRNDTTNSTLGGGGYNQSITGDGSILNPFTQKGSANLNTSGGAEPIAGGTTAQDGMRGAGGGSGVSPSSFQSLKDTLQAARDAIQTNGEALGMAQSEINKLKAERDRQIKDDYNKNTSPATGNPAGTVELGKTFYKTGDNFFTDGSIWPSEGSGDGLTGAPGSPKIEAIYADDVNGSGKAGVLLLRESTESDFIPTLYDMQNDVSSQDYEPWTNSTLAPLDSSYVPGEVWRVVGGYVGSTIYGLSLRQVLNTRAAYTGSTVYGVNASNVILNVGGDYTDNFIAFGGSGKLIGSTFSGGTIYALDSISTNRIQRVSCASTSPGSDIMCASNPPRVETFPITGTIALSWKNGKLQYNTFDSEVPSTLKQPTSVLEMTDVDGNLWEIGNTNQGGWYLTYKDALPDSFVPAIIIRPDRTIREVVNRNLLPFFSNYRGPF